MAAQPLIGCHIFIRLSWDGTYYGMVMPVRVSVRPFFALFCYMLWLFAYVFFFQCTTDQIRVSSLCVNYWRRYAPFETRNTENMQFSAFFSNMLWQIELKFCIWRCFNVLQIKFECYQFASIFVRVKLLHALTYWAEILYIILFLLTSDQVRVSSVFIRPSLDGIYYGMVMSGGPGLRPSVSFPHFSPTCFSIWANFLYDFSLTLMHVRSNSNAINFCLFLQ